MYLFYIFPLLLFALKSSATDLMIKEEKMKMLASYVQSVILSYWMIYCLLSNTCYSTIYCKDRSILNSFDDLISIWQGEAFSTYWPVSVCTTNHLNLRQDIISYNGSFNNYGTVSAVLWVIVMAGLNQQAGYAPDCKVQTWHQLCLHFPPVFHHLVFLRKLHL